MGSCQIGGARRKGRGARLSITAAKPGFLQAYANKIWKHREANKKAIISAIRICPTAKRVLPTPKCSPIDVHSVVRVPNA